MTCGMRDDVTIGDIACYRPITDDIHTLSNWSLSLWSSLDLILGFQPKPWLFLLLSVFHSLFLLQWFIFSIVLIAADSRKLTKTKFVAKWQLRKIVLQILMESTLYLPVSTLTWWAQTLWIYVSCMLKWWLRHLYSQGKIFSNSWYHGC